MNGRAAGRPNFFILGASKSGTTSLYEYLRQHPDVYCSEPKEPIFFEAEYEKGLEFSWNKYFSGWNGESAIGDARVFNLFLPYVPPRIREVRPEARLIAILRDPVERAFSHWWHRYSRGVEELPFAEAIRENRASIDAGLDFAGEAGERRWRRGLYRNSITTRYRLYLDLGLYAEQLERYFELFPCSQIRIVLYDDLAKDPAGVTRDLWSFLGVEPTAPLADASARNEQRRRLTTVGGYRLELLADAARLRHVTPRFLRPHLRKLVRERQADRPPLEQDVRQALTAYFEAPIRRLEDLVGRDLSAWGKADASAARAARAAPRG